MDALAALSLACNVIQLVEFTVESIQGCKELYDNGVRNDDAAIELLAKNITDANTALQDALKGQQQQQIHPRGCPPRLAKIAEDSTAAAGQILIEIDKLKLSHPEGIRRAGAAFGHTLRRFANSGKISKIQKQLKRHEEALKSSLIKEIYAQLNSDDAFRNAELASLAQSQQAIVDRILASQSAITGRTTHELLALEDRLTMRLRAQDTAAADQFEIQSILLSKRALDSRKRHVLGALSFPDQKKRQNMVESRLGEFGGTYKWIFSRPASCAAATSADDIRNDPGAGLSYETCSLGDDGCDTGSRYRFSTSRERIFMEWLEHSSSGLYWITGKAGSGKSSLMNYIYLNLDREVAKSQQLGIWAGSKEIRLVSFWFFKPASSPLLRTMQGFWRSLCFQILNADDSLPAQICSSNPDNTAPASLRSCLVANGSDEVAWTDRELEIWLHYLVAHSKLHYIFLIDGLDEMEDDHGHLLDVIVSLSKQHKTIKMCCASRSEPLFSRRLSCYAHLYLDKVNSADIVRCCRSMLQGTAAECFATGISTRASGVFLWAHLVAKELARASMQRASMDELALILDDCPDEIGQLFSHMLQRMERYARRRPKPHLLLVQHATSSNTALSLFELYFATLPASEVPKWRDLSGKFDASYLQALNHGLQGFWSRVETACAGLVEITIRDDLLDRTTTRVLRDTAPTEDSSEILQACTKQVGFIHSSVSDFLQVDDIAQAHLADAAVSADQVAAKLAEAAAAKAFLTDEKLPTDMSVRRLALKVLDPLHKNAGARRSASAQEILNAFFDQLARRIPVSSTTTCFPTTGGEYVPDLPLSDNLKFAWISSFGYWDLVKIYLDKEQHERQAMISGYSLWRYCCRGFWTESTESLCLQIYPGHDILEHFAFSYQDSWKSSRQPTTTALILRTSLPHHLVTIGARLRIDSDSETLSLRTSALSILKRCLDHTGETLADMLAVWESRTGGLLLLPGLDYHCRNKQSECLDDHFVFHLRFRASDIFTDAPLSVLLVGWKLKEHAEFLQFRRPHVDLDMGWRHTVEETLREDVTKALEVCSQRGLQRSAEDLVPSPHAESTTSGDIVNTFMTSFWAVLECVNLVGVPDWPLFEQQQILAASWIGYSDEYDPTMFDEGLKSAVLSNTPELADCDLADTGDTVTSAASGTSCQ